MKLYLELAEEEVEEYRELFGTPTLSREQVIDRLLRIFKKFIVEREKSQT